MATVTLKGGQVELPQEMLDAAGLQDGQQLQIDVPGPGSLRLSTAGQEGALPPPAPRSLTPEEHQRRSKAMMAAHQRRFTRASDEERARTPQATDEDRVRVARALSRGRSLVADIIEEREAGY